MATTATEQTDVERQISLAMAALDRQFGQNTIMKLNSSPEPWPAISTGGLSLDIALGIGGLPRGRIVEVFGSESSGKSTLCLNILANAQKMGGRCLFIDAEHALDPVYAQALGVNVEDLVFAQPTTGEEALTILEKMVSTGGFAVAIVDSVAALTPRAELEGEMGDSHMALLARLMSQGMRKLTGVVNETNTLVIFTNQIREKVGIVYGNPEVTPGGRALKFHSSVRIQLKRRKDVTSKKDGSIIGSMVEANVRKNKMAPPFRKAEFQITYGRGINYLDSVINAAETTGVLKKAGGGWYSYDGVTLAQGSENMLEHLASDMEFTRKLEEEAMEAAGVVRNEHFRKGEEDDDDDA